VVLGVEVVAGVASVAALADFELRLVI